MFRGRAKFGGSGRCTVGQAEPELSRAEPELSWAEPEMDRAESEDPAELDVEWTQDWVGPVLE